MKYFVFDPKDPKAEYYESLDELMERWEYEIVEFKEAKGQYSEEKIGQYFSAISNEANLAGKQYGWFVLGVSEGNDDNKRKHLVGTSFKYGSPQLLDKFKYTIGKDTTDGITFLEIIELFPVCNGKSYRVLMFKVPAAVTGFPTEWKQRSYARSGDSLVPLQQYKIDAIRNQERRDWSGLTLHEASIRHLDQNAIAYAREKYKEKMNRPHISEEVDEMNDEEFLEKVKLTKNGRVTHAAMILLGNADYDYLFASAPAIMWRLYNENDDMLDCEIFSIPFINVADRLFPKIRNLTYRYMPNMQSLELKQTEQYNTWLVQELLNNCIAHSNYQLGGRIYVDEFPNSLVFVNPGDFLPQNIERVLQRGFSPPFYRNRLLADEMVNFRMIDSASSGIKKVYKIQKAKYFPMPDYDFSTSRKVSVRVYGKTLDEKYTHVLYDHPDLDLETVYLLDQVQKGNGKLLTSDAIAFLRKHKLIEGRSSSLSISAAVAHTIDEEAQYIKNRGFDDQYYQDLIVEYLKKFKTGKKKDFRSLLWDKLPDALRDEQKECKISTLLQKLKRLGVIATDSANRQKCSWTLCNECQEQRKM